MTARIARLSILDSYGVRWARESFARDLLQNFFDSAADFRDVTLDVRGAEGVVEIRGPATFDIDLLAYIGATTKTSGRTVGGFGEGFKICALIGARDFGLTISAGSGAHEIAVFFDPVPLGRELCYRVTTREGEPLAGSYVRLTGCDAATLAAFEAAPAMFRHPDNPNLAEAVLVDPEQGIGVYRSPSGDHGELYYRRQRRGTARFYGSGGQRALTLAHDAIIDELEGDRDRRDLPAEPIARAIGDKLAPEALHRVILELVSQWRCGNDILSGLLAAAIARGLRFAWPPRWLARSFKSPALAQFAERQGFFIALAAFAQIGMATPEDHYKELQTRAASPLEMARFDVVADLYGELLGQPARTKKLEVFDLTGSAVAGQHLGDKVIVGAQLIARGFDAAAGTILHELAHEAGGEEDIRFLRRLTNLLGAALREPEKIRAARRRYAAVRASRARPRPIDDAPAGPPRAYMPEMDHREDDHEGVVVTVLVPPAFPPAASLTAAVRAAAEDVGVGVWLAPVHVSGPVGAATWRAPGLPTLYIGGVDPGRPLPARGAQPPPPEPYGYRLRTYGPGGQALVPDAECLRAAILRAKRLGLTGRAGLVLHQELCDDHRARVHAALGVVIPEPRKRRPSPTTERDEALRGRLAASIGERGGFELADVWVHGQEAAAEAWIRALKKDRRPVEVLFDEIADRLDLAMEHAGALRSADPDHDDADGFERDAMLAAMGASVSAYARGAGETDARSLAAEAFGLARAATARVLDVDVAADAKPVLLCHAMKCAGLGWAPSPRTRSFEPRRFQEGLEHAVTEALRMQRCIDEDGGWLSTHELHQKIDPFAEEPARRRLLRRNQVRWERFARATHALHELHDRVLAEEGSEIAAAARCLEEAARLVREDIR